MSKSKKIPPNLFLEGIRNKDSLIIRSVMKACLPMVTNHVLKNKGNKQDAEDLLAEAFMVVFQKAKDPKFSINYAVSTYVFTICKNLWLKQLRRRKFKDNGDLSDIEMAILTDDVLALMEKEERAKLYQEKIKMLDKQSQYILFLFYREKKSFKEIAQIMELKSPGYAKKLKFLAQKKLIKLVKQDPRYEELKS